MDAGRMVKGIVALVLVVFLWKVGLPWIQKQGSGASSRVTSAGGGCVQSAERASEAWGSGLSRFVNPPYDIGAWSGFRSDVEGKVGAAEAQCRCEAESCAKVRNAMSELRGLVSDLDGAIRNGTSPPFDAVTRQESIDNQINDAGELARAGK